MKRLALIIAILASACGSTGDRARPQTELERGFFFQERDRRGKDHPISARSVKSDGAPAVVERIADGATLDVNSTLTIQVPRSSATKGWMDDSALEDLTKQATDLSRALAAIGTYLDLEAKADIAFVRYNALPRAQRNDSPEQEAFIALKNQRGAAELAMLDPIRNLWPAQSSEVRGDRAEAERLVKLLGNDTDRPGAISALNELAQSRVRNWSRQARQLEEDTKQALKSRRVRIEAFVVTRGGPEQEHAKNQTHAVHVEGYDNLDADTVQLIDPYGVNLTAPERERLAAAAAASKELAARLEQVRRGEMKWNEAFRGSQDAIVASLDQLADLARSLSPDELGRRATATAKAVETFAGELRTLAKEVADAHAADWQSKLGEALAERGELEQLFALVAGIDALSTRWKYANLNTLPQLALESFNLLKRLGDVLSDDELLSGAVDALVKEITQQLADVGEEARPRVLQLWEPVRADIEGWSVLATRARGGLERIREYLKDRPAPVSLTTENAAAFSVPLESAPEARIDLRTTPRQAGDALQVRVRMLNGETDTDAEPQLDAILGIAKLGWHADQVPSIVFVTADRNVGASDTGGFSAALSWIWSYGPRDDDGDEYLSRSLGWGAGLHATFLNFGPDNDSEIGLGLTVGLWQNRLMFGAGYNPFAESDGDARIYYFVGSSLIPLLQAMDSKN